MKHPDKAVTIFNDAKTPVESKVREAIWAFQRRYEDTNPVAVLTNECYAACIQVDGIPVRPVTRGEGTLRPPYFMAVGPSEDDSRS